MNKICPINPHGTGFCYGHNCMLFRQAFHVEKNEHPDEGECVFTEIADSLRDISGTLYSGIYVYEGEDNND